MSTKPPFGIHPKFFGWNVVDEPAIKASFDHFDGFALSVYQIQIGPLTFTEKLFHVTWTQTTTPGRFLGLWVHKSEDLVIAMISENDFYGPDTRSIVLSCDHAFVQANREQFTATAPPATEETLKPHGITQQMLDAPRNLAREGSLDSIRFGLEYALHTVPPLTGAITVIINDVSYRVYISRSTPFIGDDGYMLIGTAQREGQPVWLFISGTAEKGIQIAHVFKVHESAWRMYSSVSANPNPQPRSRRTEQRAWPRT